MTVMKDRHEGQPEHAHFCTKGNSCVSAVTFGVGSWSIAERFTVLARAITSSCVERLSLLNVLFHADA